MNVFHHEIRKADIFMAMNLKGDSPIEQLFFVALCAILETHSVPDTIPATVKVTPQKSIGNYRADFLLERFDKNKNLLAHVIVELDGHNFHDKNESQRRHEKKRDRFLAAEGYKVLHFTGKEVTDNPFKVAAETLSILIGVELYHFSPVNYLPEDQLKYIFEY